MIREHHETGGDRRGLLHAEGRPLVSPGALRVRHADDKGAAGIGGVEEGVRVSEIGSLEEQREERLRDVGAVGVMQRAARRRAVVEFNEKAFSLRPLTAYISPA